MQGTKLVAKAHTPFIVLMVALSFLGWVLFFYSLSLGDTDIFTFVGSFLLMYCLPIYVIHIVTLEVRIDGKCIDEIRFFGLFQKRYKLTDLNSTRMIFNKGKRASLLLEFSNDRNLCISTTFLNFEKVEMYINNFLSERE